MSAPTYEDLGNPDHFLGPLPEEELEAEEETLGPDDEDGTGLAYAALSDSDKEFVHQVILRTIIFCEELADMELRPYQRDMAYRLIESIILADGEELTATWSRQSGKSETMAIIVAGVMVLFPKLALSYPMFERFKRGVWIGLFAPTDGQSEFIYGRVRDKLTNDRAKMFLSDPEIDEKVDDGAKVLKLRSGSFCRRQTANPKAKVEGASYHVVILDEAQEADDLMVRKSIHPMLAANSGTICKIGTPSFHKGDYYKAIQHNKRRSTNRGGKNYHFEYNWKVVAKYNPYYAKFIQKEKVRLGEDSDEFQMSYCVAPETAILTADLRHISASSVTPGMKLVGFDEDRPGPGLHRQFKEAEVEDVGRITRPCYRLELSDGTRLTCSTEHQWLVMTPGGRTVWKTTDSLTEADRIFKLTEVWGQGEYTYESGYLAAAFEGEGHLSHGPLQLGFSQKENVMLDQVKKHLADLGFSPTESVSAASDVHRLNIGSRTEIMRFLGEVRPQRLLDKLDVNRLGSIGRHDQRREGFEHPRIVSKTFLGDQEVIAIRTSTRTYVAEGLASHNCLRWMLDRGMLVTEEDMDYLADRSMELVKSWHRTACVAGIDVARVKDSTVVTVCWVDWDHPDPAGYYEHRILNWLEITNTDWEEQYFEIVDFLSNYNIVRVGVDAQGMGDAVAQRLDRLMGHRCEVVPVNSDLKNQADRWKHLIQLLQRNLVVYPGHSKARRTRVWKRFRQQMEDAEKVMKGNYMLIQAPDDTRDAHDDYVDSLAIATMMTVDDVGEEVSVSEAPWFR